MNDGRSLRTAVAERVHVSHDVVPQPLLFLSCHREVYVVQVGLHLLDLFICDGQTQRLLCLRQPQPELPPRPELVPVTKHEAHLRAGIAGGERGTVAVGPAAVACRGHAERATRSTRARRAQVVGKSGSGSPGAVLFPPRGGTSGARSPPPRSGRLAGRRGFPELGFSGVRGYCVSFRFREP